MVEILSSARTQSVKEIKKKARAKRRKKQITKWIIIIIIVIILAFLINNFILQNKYSYVDKDSGITFYSKDFYVKDVFTILSKDQNTLLVFNIMPDDMNDLGLFVEQINYLQSVFAAKQKINILIINVMDETRRTISCQSNLGDLYTNEELTKEECSELLKSNTTSIIIDFPDETLEESVVIGSVGEKYIYIQTKSKEDLDKAVLLVTTMMFEDINYVNSAVENIRNQMDANIS